MQGRPFALLGVNNDGKLSRVKKAIRENELNWRSWFDGNRGPIVASFGIRSFPTIFLVDHTGVIRYKNVRGAKLDKAIEKLVSEAEGDGMVGEVVVREPEFRTFKDSQGKYSIYAIFESVSDGQVKLKKKDGDHVTVPLAKLSRRDQDYLKRGGFLQQTVESTQATAAETRLFSDASGEFQVKATLVKVEGDQVTLRKEDGDQITVPLDRFSDEDQEYIRQKADRDSG